MIWQDIVPLVGNIVFTLALIPSIVSKEKPHRLSCGLTAGILLTYVFTFWSINLWYWSLATLATAEGKEMNEYEGHWLTTFKGKKFHYLDPQEDEIDIRDIAHALSLTCRFGGHCKEFYSVAEHSVRVAQEVSQENKLAALLHDAHEAYLHDVPRPVKQDISGYKEIADGIQQAINQKFGVFPTQEIRKADNVLLMTEARDLGLDTTDWAECSLSILDEVIYPWTSSDAEASFLAYFGLWGR